MMGGQGPPPRYVDNYDRGPRTLKTVYGDEGGVGHRIHMRGLPFRASEDDIADVNDLNKIFNWFI